MTGPTSTPGGRRGNGRPPAAVDHALVTAVRTAVLDKWDAERGEHPRRLDRGAERQLFRRFIVDELEEVGRRRLRDGVSQLTQEDKHQLIRAVESEIHGIGRLEALLAIPGVEDIRIVGDQSPKLLMADGTVKEAIDPTGLPVRVAESEADLLAQLQFIAAHRGGTERSFSTAHPALDMPLPDGSRLAALRDVAPYPVVTIRRHHLRGVTLEDLEQRGMISPGMRRFLAALVRARRNILVTGIPKAGKTTLLMALANEIPDEDSFATLETEFELGLHLLPNPHPLLIPLECRQGSTEVDPITGRRAGEVTLADLLTWVLRHSISRVIIGEVRGVEAFHMLAAMNAGLMGSMCTLHANSAHDALTRLVNAALPGAGPSGTETYLNRLAGAGIDYIVNVRHIDHTAFGGGRARFVSEIYEVLGTNEPGAASPFAMTKIFEPLEGVDLRGHFRNPPERRRPFEDVGIQLDFLQRGADWSRPLDLASRGGQR